MIIISDSADVIFKRIRIPFSVLPKPVTINLVFIGIRKSFGGRQIGEINSESKQTNKVIKKVINYSE